MTASEEGSRSSSDWKNTDEQEKGLLEGWQSNDGHEEERIPVVPAKSWRRCGILTGSVSMVLAVVLMIVVLASPEVWKHWNGASSIPSELGPVQTSDYILDPAWDYSASPQRREYTWTVRDTFHNPDGVYRPMILVNNQFPGPLIEVNEGDTIVVHVNNQAVNATSMHWHGIYQNGTPHMDGTVGISQCAIAPGRNFTYDFTVNGQSGTYYWHAHQGVTVSDGMYGPLIIHGRREKELQRIEYASDRVVMVSDHYHDLSSALLWQYLKPDMENAEPVPESALINGRGAVRDCTDYPERRCDNSTANVGLPTLDLEPGKSHRMRLINVGAFAAFQVQIDEHELAITEVDGTDVVPMTYHRININPAQRYSMVVSANGWKAKNFWLRARMITECFTDPPETLQSEVRAIIRHTPQVAESNVQEPMSVDWEETLEQECRDMNTTELVPVDMIAAPERADAFFYLRSNFEIGKYRLSRGFFNSSSFRPNPRAPSLIRAIDGITALNDSFDAPAVTSSGDQQVFINDVAFDGSNELTIQTTGIQTVDIMISNFDDGSHPIHLHGYKYFVLASGHGYPPLTYVGAEINTANLAPLYDTLDLSNPLPRDTASVEAFGWLLIRIVADNPGMWALHCHLSWHSEAGLMMQMLTRSDALAGMEVPKAHRELCAADGSERRMGPQDEDYREVAR